MDHASQLNSPLLVFLAREHPMPVPSVELLVESLPLEGWEREVYEALDENYAALLCEETRIRLARAFHLLSGAKRIQATKAHAQELVEFRNKMRVDGILYRQLEQSQVFHQCWPSRLYGEDTYGHIINFERIQELQSAVFLKEFDCETMLRHRTKHMERMKAEREYHSNRLGRRIYKYIYILDLAGLGTNHLSAPILSLMKPLFNLGQHYYPETLHRMYLVNAPWVFRGLWSMVSSWIDPETRTKIQVLGGKKDFLQAAAKDNIPIEALPRELGGLHDGIVLDDTFVLSRDKYQPKLAHTQAIAAEEIAVATVVEPVVG